MEKKLNLSPLNWTSTRATRATGNRSRSGRRRLSFDALEDRTMLSITIAALGDSLTDEYQFYAPYRTAADNWPEIISTLRPSQVNFGAFSASGAGRGQTQNQGYAEDWALSGATASGFDVSNYGATFVNEYEGGYTPGGTPPPSTLPGLLTQTGGISNIDAVNILIGGNDYFAALQQAVTQAETTLKTDFNSSTGININTILQIYGEVTQLFVQTNDNIVQSLTTTVTQIEAANPNTHIILDATPSVAYTPIFQSEVSGLPTVTVDILGTPTTINLAKEVTDFVNKQVDNLDYNGNTSGPMMPYYQSIQSLATSMSLGFVDANALVKNFVANPTFAGMYINPAAAGPVYTDMFVGDGIHPGTIAQAMLTNAIIKQIDTWYPNAITPLSNPEILQLAQNVQPKTTVLLAASPRSVNPGQPVTFKASVPSFRPNYETSLAPPPPPSPPSTPPPQYVAYPAATGTVTFIDASDGNKVLATEWLIPSMNAVVTFTAGFGVGLHQIEAVYSGDNVYPPAVSQSVSILVGASPAQVKVLNFVETLPEAAIKKIPASEVKTWLGWVDHGAKPIAVDRAILRSVHLSTRLASTGTIAARSKAVAQTGKKRV